MANTKLPSRLLDTSAVPALNVTGDLTVDTTSLRVDSTNNRVGIGTSSPSELLEVRKDGGDARLKVQTAGGNDAILILDAPGASGAESQMRFDDSGTTAGSIIYAHNSGGTDFMTFGTGGSNTERMRIDSSGNVIVSGTAAGQVTSVALHNTGYVHAVSSHQMAGVFDRRDSDGDVLLLRKQGAEIGSIGVNNSRFTIEGPDNPVRITTGTSNMQINHDADITFDIANIERMRIKSDGNVSVDNAKLKALAKSNSDTAIDIFVYDTQKDSDGGAWRKRTQHTSWFNESLNTSTRGSRKEFPSIAVLVVEAGKVTIYDGDEPDMPMWMVFTANNGGWNTYAMGGGSTVSSIVALNGTITLGNSGYGITINNFISEESQFIEAGYHRYRAGGLAKRNGGMFGGPEVGTARQLSHDQVNDVAMTVLPTARISQATGLPVPTIAVATRGGITVMPDDGTANVEINHTSAGYNHWDTVEFTKDHKLIINANYNNTSNQLTHVVDIPTATVTVNVVNARISALNGRYYHGDTSVPVLNNSSFFTKIAPMQQDVIAFGHPAPGTGGLDIVAEEPSTVSGVTSNAAIAYITDSYNTGWMVGKSILATLSDTDTANVVGASKLTNDLMTGFTGTGGHSGVLTVNGNGTVTVANGNGTADALLHSTAFTLVIGKTYVVDIQTSSASGTGLGFYLNSTGGPEGYLWNRTKTFVATQTNNTFFLYRYRAHNGTGTVNKIIIREAVEDRNNVFWGGNAMQAFGTIGRTVVETGAELVAFGPWSSSNYLAAPQGNQKMNVGTGDFAYSFWFKKTGGGINYVFDRANGNGNQRLGVYFANSHQIQTYTETNAIDGVEFTANKWNHYTVTRRSGTMTVYINGEQRGSVSNSQNMTVDTDGIFRIGTRHSGSDAATDAVYALFRNTPNPPSHEQIIMMYNDELPLFQENAKATLYGTSRQITDLAYDDSTELLHVGTSAGRSVFQGLNRIDNTTDAVGTSISAVNGFIVED